MNEDEGRRAAAPASQDVEAGLVGASTSHGDLERAFHRDMLDIYARAAREIGYRPTRFLHLVEELGGVAAAKRLLAKGGSEGMTTLWMKGRLDLSMESHVLLPRYEGLFSEKERRVARQRLFEHGFDPGR